MDMLNFRQVLCGVHLVSWVCVSLFFGCEIIGHSRLEFGSGLLVLGS